MQVEKTIVFKVDGKTYTVSELPKPIIQLINKLDAAREKHASLALDYEMSALATSVMSVQVQEVIRQMEKAEADAREPAPETKEEEGNVST